MAYSSGPLGGVRCNAPFCQINLCLLVIPLIALLDKPDSGTQMTSITLLGQATLPPVVYAGNAGLARTLESGRRSRKRLVLCAQQPSVIESRRRSAHGFQNRMGSHKSIFPWLRRVHRNVRNILELPTLQWVALSGLPSSGSKIEVALLDKPGSGTLMTNTALQDKPAVAHSPGAAQDLLRWNVW